MAGRASIARHPIHPMLIVFPIGLWVFAFVCDLIYHWGNHVAIWKDVAFYAMAGGVIGALAAAIPGFVDYVSINDRHVRGVATWHMGLNLVIVVLYVVNLWMRSRTVQDATGPVWLSFVSIILLTASGWLGGEMVYVLGTAVDPHSNPKIDVHRRTPAREDVRHQA